MHKKFMKRNIYEKGMLYEAIEELVKKYKEVNESGEPDHTELMYDTKKREMWLELVYKDQEINYDDENIHNIGVEMQKAGRKITGKNVGGYIEDKYAYWYGVTYAMNNEPYRGSHSWEKAKKMLKGHPDWVILKYYWDECEFIYDYDDVFGGIWYAVVPNPREEWSWDLGSVTYKTAVEILKDYQCGRIEVIDDSDGWPRIIDTYEHNNINWSYFK